ncbi:hypothetical protein [Paenibacillus donghaensis]|uniref:hypothetical protein n=1 Tax=Paenibacillus donghaensis TaxID=414771 RepID=UPI0012FCDA91|nr:hypothetical protein [Paenibacillus donghaensis]
MPAIPLQCQQYRYNASNTATMPYTATTPAYTATAPVYTTTAPVYIGYNSSITATTASVYRYSASV